MSSKTKTSGMKEGGKPALVPKLRFPAFQGAEAWKASRLDEVLSPVVRVRTKPNSTYVGLGLRSHGKGTFLKPLEDPAKNSMDQLYEVRPNDLIVNITFAWEGAVAIAKECDDGALVSHRFPTYTFEKGRATPEFFRYIILDKQFVYNLGVISPGGAGRNRVLNKNDFLKLQVSIPSPREQQKIAECLSSVDEVITAHARNLDALKVHKKGLMQQLFPREGETQPRLRFREFQSAGEWGAKVVKTFCKVGDTDHKMPSSVADGIPYIMTGNFFGINGIDYEGAKKISAEDYEQLSKKIRPEFGDIVIARYASVGAVRYIETKLKFLVSYSCAIIKCSRSESSQYLYYIFQSDVIQSKIGLEINASSQKNIGIDSIKNLNIFLPTLPEQQKIADFFATLDALINADTQKLEALKRHKRGLMQQLFPSPEKAEA